MHTAYYCIFEGEVNKQNDLELCKAASFGFGLKQNWDVECADLKRKWEQLFCNSGGLEMQFLGKSVAGKQVELGIDAAGSSFQGSADFNMKNDDKSGQGETERVESNSESDKSSGGSTTDGGGDGRSFKHLGL